MNDAHYTSLGERPDLAALNVLQPESYIADSIYPVVPVMDKSGTIYYATTNANAAAQTGRSAGAAPSNTQISDSDTTFTCAEAIKRYSVTPDEAKQMGGIENADRVGAEAAKRSVFRAIESAVCTEVLGGTPSNNYDPAKLQTDFQTAVDSLDLYEGRTTLVTSTKTAKAMVQGLLADATHGPAISRLVSGTSPSVARTGLNFQAWADALALLLGVDGVLLGNDSIWNATAVQGRFAVVKVDDSGDPLSHKYRATLGKRYQFLPDGSSPWIVESIPDRLTKNNHYDASIWYNVVTLNSGALYLFDGVADA